MRERSEKVFNVGTKEDGTFWMSFNDYFANFSTTYVCRFFGDDYTAIFFESEWSTEKGTAGGCIVNDTFYNNPQWFL